MTVEVATKNPALVSLFNDPTQVITLDADRLIIPGERHPQLVFDTGIHHEGKAHDKAQGLACRW